jgi:hypothetical protein
VICQADRRDGSDQARALLTDIYNQFTYNRFTEDFDAADLKDTKALLGELSI